jgi:hypothetical protein
MRKLFNWYSYKYGAYLSRSHELLSRKGSIPEWEHRYLTESLMSDIWQTWCLFNRTLIFKSIRGAKFRNGASVSGRAGDNSWLRLGYESSAYKSGRNTTAFGHSNFAMWKEPTWGDLDAFVKIIMGFNPPNSANLLAAYGGNFDGVKHLQNIRNCSAHKNVENYLDLRSLALVYSLPPVITPVSIVWSMKLGTNTLAIESWLRETIVIADMATASI